MGFTAEEAETTICNIEKARAREEWAERKAKEAPVKVKNYLPPWVAENLDTAERRSFQTDRFCVTCLRQAECEWRTQYGNLWICYKCMGV